MAKILPQQLLFLELLISSGDIAVNEDAEDTILGRTLKECVTNGWTEHKTFGGGFNKVSITDAGRKAAALSESE